MQISYDWLGDYVELPELEVGIDRLTAAGMAVETVDQVGSSPVLDVDVTTNRVDAMNHLGLARELATALGVELAIPEHAVGGDGPAATSVSIAAPELCRRYVARVLRGVTVGPSPEWLEDRLRSIGLRPINNVVDVTNFVLWECGQPLHAFDLATLGEGRIVVRLAADGERVVTLDGVERELTPEMLVIADASRPVALAGVMGGAETEVGDATTDLLIESAWFDPQSVRATAKALGMHTDASHRFERGTDPERCLWAADRAASIILEIAGGSVDGPAVDAVGAPLEPLAVIELDSGRLDAFTGVAIPAADVEATLGGLGFAAEASGDGSWRVTVPSWRRFDVTDEADLFEEAMRHFGYDEVPSTLPGLVGSDGPELASHRLRRELRDLLAASGFAEAINYGFVSADQDASVALIPGVGASLALDNPLSELYATMRRSLLPGLAAAARFNRRRNLPAVALFEIGHVFWAGDDGESWELDHLAVIAGGTQGSPWEREVEVDFYDVKGVVEAVAASYGVHLAARAADLEGFVSGRAAELVAGDRVIGIAGELDEDSPPYPLFAAELDASVLGGDAVPSRVVPPSRFPGIAVDTTVTHPVETPWSDIAATIREQRVADLESFALTDRYTGEGVPDGAVNTTISFVYNATDRSLTQEEVNERHHALAELLESRFGRR